MLLLSFLVDLAHRMSLVDHYCGTRCAVLTQSGAVHIGKFVESDKQTNVVLIPDGSKNQLIIRGDSVAMVGDFIDEETLPRKKKYHA